MSTRANRLFLRSNFDDASRLPMLPSTPAGTGTHYSRAAGATASLAASRLSCRPTTVGGRSELPQAHQIGVTAANSLVQHSGLPLPFSLTSGATEALDKSCRSHANGASVLSASSSLPTNTASPGTWFAGQRRQRRSPAFHATLAAVLNSSSLLLDPLRSAPHFSSASSICDLGDLLSLHNLLEMLSFIPLLSFSLVAVASRNSVDLSLAERAALPADAPFVSICLC